MSQKVGMIGRLREDEEVSLCNNIDAQKLQFETMEFQRKIPHRIRHSYRHSLFGFYLPIAIQH